MLELTLLEEDDELVRAPGASAGLPPFAAAPSAPSARETLLVPAVQRAAAARGAPTAQGPEGVASSVRPSASLPVTALPMAPPALESAMTLESATPPADAPADEPAVAPSRSALSLHQLGIGPQPFAATAPLAGQALAPSPFSPAAEAPLPSTAVAQAPLTEAERANLRLQASLRQPAFDPSRRGDVSSAGPVVTAAHQLVSGDETLLETSAVLNVRVDGGGRVTGVQVLDASNQNAAWQMIAARLMKDLGGVKLQRPGASQGWGMKLRLSSAVQLPSGVAPGLRTDVLGQALPGSAPAGATSLSLSPTSPLLMPEPIDKVGRQRDHVITVELGLLKLKGDVADLAAAARRVVHVAVLSVDDAASPRESSP